MKKIFLISTIVIVVSLVLTFAKRVNNENLVPSPTPETIEEGWEKVFNTSYEFVAPTEATKEDRTNETIITFMGQKQIDSGRTQTELFDGYAFRVGREIVNSAGIESFARIQRENAAENCFQENGEVSEIEKINLNGIDAYQYFATNCYLDYRETFIENNNYIYRLSESYVGDSEDYPKYKEITNKILSSFKIK